MFWMQIAWWRTFIFQTKIIGTTDRTNSLHRLSGMCLSKEMQTKWNDVKAIKRAEWTKGIPCKRNENCGCGWNNAKTKTKRTQKKHTLMPKQQNNEWHCKGNEGATQKKTRRNSQCNLGESLRDSEQKTTKRATIVQRIQAKEKQTKTREMSEQLCNWLRKKTKRVKTAWLKMKQRTKEGNCVAKHELFSWANIHTRN